MTIYQGNCNAELRIYQGGRVIQLARMRQNDEGYGLALRDLFR
jgi:hypothetical protein